MSTPRRHARSGLLTAGWLQPSLSLAGLSLTGLLLAFTSCRPDTARYGEGDLRVVVEPGSAWLHDFPLLFGIERRNAPQIAVWVEDTGGRYLRTLYVSEKIASQGWLLAGDNRRREALPVWCHARGVRYDDGLYLPTRSQPLTDATSGATPRGAFVIGFSSDSLPQRFVIRAEVNHSTDFNDAYPKEAEPGSPGWSGGAMGSGQPALVWAATVDLTSRDSCWQARPIGHSSPDGTDGRIDLDLSQLTSALRIVHRIAVCRH